MQTRPCVFDVQTVKVLCKCILVLGVCPQSVKWYDRSVLQTLYY